MFRIFDLLEAFYDVNGLSGHKMVRDFALLQGVIGFFLKWKLSEKESRENRADLMLLQDLLRRIPEETLTQFYVEKNSGPIAALALLVRRGKFATAQKLSRTVKPHQRLDRAGITPDRIIETTVQQLS